MGTGWKVWGRRLRRNDANCGSQLLEQILGASGGQRDSTASKRGQNLLLKLSVTSHPTCTDDGPP